jgi:hypothetical protein
MIKRKGDYEDYEAYEDYEDYEDYERLMKRQGYSCFTGLF